LIAVSLLCAIPAKATQQITIAPGIILDVISMPFPCNDIRPLVLRNSPGTISKKIVTLAKTDAVQH